MIILERLLSNVVFSAHLCSCDFGPGSLINAARQQVVLCAPAGARLLLLDAASVAQRGAVPAEVRGGRRLRRLDLLPGGVSEQRSGCAGRRRTDAASLGEEVARRFRHHKVDAAS